MWVGDTTPDSIRHAVRSTSEAGFDLLELSLHDLERLDVPGTRTLLAEAGLGVVCSRGLAFDADVSSDDPAVVKRGAALLRASLETTVGLGGRIFTGALFSALGKYPAAPTPAGRANAVSVIRELATAAADNDVTLGLEVCNRYETNLVNTARQAVELADDIGADNVMVHLDTYHMNIEEADMARPVREVGDRLGYVHIGENHRGFLGSGHIDFTSFFHALGDIGYRGPITFESFSSSVVARGLSDDLAVWRDLWEDGRELADHALNFTTAMLAVSGPAKHG